MIRAPLPRLRALARDRTGVAATEAALALPFVLMLGGGILEFGVMLYRVQLMEAGVRDAARYLARTPNPAAAEGAARLLAVTGSVTGTATPRVPHWTTGHVAVTYRAVDNTRPAGGQRPYRGGDTVQVVRVAASVPYAGIGFLGLAGLSDLRLSAAHEERVVGG